jgi:hypothetical protein
MNKFPSEKKGPIELFDYKSLTKYPFERTLSNSPKLIHEFLVHHALALRRGSFQGLSWWPQWLKQNRCVSLAKVQANLSLNNDKPVSAEREIFDLSDVEGEDMPSHTASRMAASREAIQITTVYFQAYRVIDFTRKIELPSEGSFPTLLHQACKARTRYSTLLVKLLIHSTTSVSTIVSFSKVNVQYEWISHGFWSSRHGFCRRR